MDKQQTSEIPIAKRLLQLAGIFFKIGAINFGGSMALVAIMEQEFVQKRKWLSQEHFLDFVAATNMVPGPNACELSAFIGHNRAGYAGLVVAEFCFFLPAVISSTILAAIYKSFGTLPQLGALFYGINPIILALILMATFSLGKSTLKNWSQLMIFAFALTASFFNIDEVIIIFGAGFLATAIRHAPEFFSKGNHVLILFPLLSNFSLIKAQTADFDKILLKLFLFFLRTGALLFGSGMVLFAFIQEDIVDRLGWLTQQQLIDAIAVGQMTPGPVTSTSAFIGYQIAGYPGAILSALGNFLPSFFIAAVIIPLIPKMRTSKPLQTFLRGVNAAVIALMLGVALTIGKNAIVDIWTLLVALGAGLILIFLKWDSVWLVLGGGLIGLIHYLIG